LMRNFVAMVAALALALAVTGFVTQAAVPTQLGASVALKPAPEATKTAKPKKTKTPKATPTPSATETPSVSAARRAADAEGDRWVQIAMVAGGGLLGSVLAFFGVGALMRAGRRRRA